jgi:hypothetical protein
MNFLSLVAEVGFPIAGAIAAGLFVFVTLKFILASVTGSVNSLKNIIGALDNRVQTMNNDLGQDRCTVESRVKNPTQCGSYCGIGR